MTVHIGLINAYSTLNLGDAAIYSAFRKLLPGAQITACVHDEQPEPISGIRFLSRRPSGCDGYVSVGGDIFNNAREWFITKNFLLNLAELVRHSRRTVLFGQSIPRSCHGLSFLALRQGLLNLAAVCVRDVQSYRRLRQAGVDVRLTFDTAFVLEGSDDARKAARALCEARGLDLARSAVVSVRAFDSMYLHDTASFVQRMAGLCQRFADAGLTPVVLIQSRAYGADHDLDVAHALVSQVPGTAIVDPFLDDSPIPSWQLAMAMFERARHVIAVRYHTAVLALAAGRVPFHLHYSNKGRDLCERLELPGCDLGGFDPVSTAEAILATRPMPFNDQAIRSRVRQDFSWCMGRLGLEAVT
jgi:polysaccharide pyruvyl transferase WcaK-like protein